MIKICLTQKVDKIKKSDKPVNKLFKDVKTLTLEYKERYKNLNNVEWNELLKIILASLNIDRYYFKSVFILWGN